MRLERRTRSRDASHHAPAMPGAWQTMNYSRFLTTATSMANRPQRFITISGGPLAYVHTPGQRGEWRAGDFTSAEQVCVTVPKDRRKGQRRMQRCTCGERELP